MIQTASLVLINSMGILNSIDAFRINVDFQLQPHRYATPRSKTSFIISLFIDKAMAWVSPYMEQDHEILGDFEGFVTTMNFIFNDSNRNAIAKIVLLNLC